MYLFIGIFFNHKYLSSHIAWALVGALVVALAEYNQKLKRMRKIKIIF